MHLNAEKFRGSSKPVFRSTRALVPAGGLFDIPLVSGPQFAETGVVGG